MVRVVLLFYLMPIWTVLLARLVLGERLTRAAALRIALALAGAAIVLWPTGADAAAPGLAMQLPLPRSLADWLGVLGGAAFAFNNVMLRREADQPEEGRALAMFFGGARRRRGPRRRPHRPRHGRAAAPGRRRLVAVDARVDARLSGRATSPCSTAPPGCRQTRPRSSC